MRVKECRAVIQLSAEDRLRFIKFATHVWLLRSLSGKQKADLRLRRAQLPAEYPLRIERFKGACCIRSGRNNQLSAVSKIPAAPLERVGDIGEIGIRILAQVDRQSLGCRVQGGL